jgi:ribosomal protein L37AE/L43A
LYQRNEPEAKVAMEGQGKADNLYSGASSPMDYTLPLLLPSLSVKGASLFIPVAISLPLKGHAAGKLQCPRCKNTTVRRSHRRNLLERLLSMMTLYPYRCEDCGHRFKRLTWKASSEKQKEMLRRACRDKGS